MPTPTTEREPHPDAAWPSDDESIASYNSIPPDRTYFYDYDDNPARIDRDDDEPDDDPERGH